MKAAGTSVPLSTEAILANARLESADVTSPMATPVESLPEPTIQDSYEARAAANDKPSNSDLDGSRSTDNNPFEDLERGAAADVRLSDQGVDLQTQIEAKQAQLARLNAALLAMSRQGKEIPSSMLEGFLMVAHDTQGAEHPLTPMQQEHLEQYAAKLAHNEATEADHKTFWIQAQVGEENVMAFVNRVLRESYILQNGVMADMANQLKQTNDLRKLIRDELAKARNVKAQWASQAKGDDQWVSKAPYGAMRVNEDLGTLELDTMDPDALERHEATIAAQQQQNASDNKVSSAEALAAINAPSSLTDKQRWELTNLIGGDDDTIKDNMDQLMGALPSMNADDLRKYLEPALRNLTHGNTDEDQILQIFGALNPTQMLTVVGDGFTNGFFGFKKQDARKFRDVTVGALFDYAGAVPTAAGNPKAAVDVANGAAGAFAGAVAGGLMLSVVGDAVGAVLGFNFFHGDQQAQQNQLSAANANDVLKQIAAQVAAEQQKQNSPTTDGAKVGDQRTINTSAEMDSYIQGLEDEVNSIGDDAQIMQVDLQDALQKNQQTIQMMSNLLKVMHDTAMAVIRNNNS